MTTALVDGTKPTPVVTPAAGSGKRKGNMTDEAFQGLVFEEATAALSYVQETVAPQRERATQYYHGRLPDIDEEDDEEDRSRAVMSEVRDTVLGMMPDFLRIFFSADGVCRYSPVAVAEPQKYLQNQAFARQATDYVHNVVLRIDNPDSFRTFYDTFQDALVRKTGFIKYWWEQSKEPRYYNWTGLDKLTLGELAGDDDTEILKARNYPGVDPATGAPTILYDVRARRVVKTGCVRIQAVPCENVIVSRRARTIEDAPLFGYSENKPRSWFIEQGFTDGDLENCDDQDANDDDSPEAIARQPVGTSVSGPGDNPAEDESAGLIKYSELYVRADRDGDGIAELIQVQCAGTAYKVLKEEPTDEIQWAAFCPYPEAHTFWGEGVGDLTMDVQRIKSRIMRDVLDSLAQAVKPQTAIVEGQVNLDDVLNPDTSNIVRQKQPGMITPLVTPFVGKEALPVLDLMTQVREQRTGQSEASQGLDPDILQSTNEKAVVATISKAQARIEMVARIFAETGMRRLFRGILKLLVANQDEARVVTLRGAAVPVDPKQWDAEMSVEPDVPLGRGSDDDQLSFLSTVLAKQEYLLQTLGPQNPIVSFDQYWFTLAKILELKGWRNAESFFADPSKMDPQAKAQFLQGLQQAAQAAKGSAQGAGPDPQTEQMKIASHEKIAAAKLDFERQQLQVNAQIAMTKLKTDAQLKAFEIATARKTTIDAADINAAVATTSKTIDSHTKIIVEGLKAKVAKDMQQTARENEGNGGE